MAKRVLVGLKPDKDTLVLKVEGEMVAMLVKVSCLNPRSCRYLVDVERQLEQLLSHKARNRRILGPSIPEFEFVYEDKAIQQMLVKFANNNRYIYLPKEKFKGNECSPMV